MLQTFLVAGHHNVQSISDRDIEEAARALAKTYETADRGIVYEHTATGVNAATGIVTATSFEGSGANLTSLPEGGMSLLKTILFS